MVDTGFTEQELGLYNNDLQMYRTPPDSKITLREFEEHALERVRVYRIIEQTTAKGKGLTTLKILILRYGQGLTIKINSLVC